MTSKRIIVGSDHGGFVLKNELIKFIESQGWSVEDAGCFDESSVDYPDIAEQVAQRIAQGQAPLGILLCGSGLGMSIAANKIEGIRAVLCHDTYSASMSRRHNNANILCMGGRVVGSELAKSVVQAFLDEKFEGGRHQKRLDKIAALESKNSGK